MTDAEGAVQVEVRGHHFDPSGEVLDYATKRVEKLGRYFEGLTRLGVGVKHDIR